MTIFWSKFQQKNKDLSISIKAIWIEIIQKNHRLVKAIGEER